VKSTIVVRLDTERLSVYRISPEVNHPSTRQEVGMTVWKREFYT
jgi:hypothetical protein